MESIGKHEESQCVVHILLDCGFHVFCSDSEGENTQSIKR